MVSGEETISHFEIGGRWRKQISSYSKTFLYVRVFFSLRHALKNEVHSFDIKAGHSERRNGGCTMYPVFLMIGRFG
jgi:hypothetical protein